MIMHKQLHCLAFTRLTFYEPRELAISIPILAASISLWQGQGALSTYDELFDPHFGVVGITTDRRL